MAASLFPYKAIPLSPSAGISVEDDGAFAYPKLSVGKVLARCRHTQPCPLSMARAKEEREKGERNACGKAFFMSSPNRF